MTWTRRLVHARPSRIGLRLLTFNLLVVFLPVAGILYLDVYENRLLAAQEREMVQQARLLAAALGDREPLSPSVARDLLGRFRRRGDARLRVYDAQGSLVADSIRVPLEPETVAAASDRYETPTPGGRTPFLYRIGAGLAAIRRVAAGGIQRVIPLSKGRPSTAEPESQSPAPEIRAALEGRYGAATRRTSGQRSLTLTSAVPIRHGDAVIGAVLVSQSTFRILQALYAVRLRIFEIVVASMIAATLLSVALSRTIVTPTVRLRREATALAERRSLLPGRFRDIDRRDEIGDLARALDELARRLDEQIRLLESFAADVSHEFRNPLTSIRTAAEMLTHAEMPADRRRFLDLLTGDVDRLERLVSGVRELARIDSQLAHEPLAEIDLKALLTDIVEGERLSGGGPVELRADGVPAAWRVRASPDRLAQVFENLVQNARSFTPPGSPIEISFEMEPGFCRVAVADRGPGIPPAHLECVFDRFFTYRPGDLSGRREHAGLGLAIARTIVQGYGGTITASNRPDGGARFDVRLPSA
jgi:two-component system, OmpR family, sensor histidine kinase ChvG